MDETDGSLPPQPPEEQQPTHEDHALLAVKRVYTLAMEALNNPNGKTFNEKAENVPSWMTPITHESGLKVAELEVSWRGLNDRPNQSGGISLRHTPINTNSETGKQEPDTQSSVTYWIDTSRQKLYKLSKHRPGESRMDSDRLEECNPITTKEVMDEYGDIIESAIHPEKVASRKKLDESAVKTSPDGTKRRGGFLMKLSSLSRKVFDPSKVFPKKRSK
jgi:hypothetical protein